MQYLVKIQLPNGKTEKEFFTGSCFDECMALAQGVFRHIYGQFIITDVTLL